MRKVVTVFLVLLLLLSLCACAKETQTKYVETQRVYELAPNMVRKTVYHFDSKWNATGYTTYVNDELETKATYTNGVNGSTITITSNGKTSTTRTYTAEKDDQDRPLTVEMYIDEQLYSTTVFTYDTDGNYTAVTQTEGTSSSTVVYNSDGKILSDEFTSQDGLPLGTDYTYDENGNEIKSVSHSVINGLPTTTEVITEYGLDGKRILSTTTEYDHEGTAKYSYTTRFTHEGSMEIAERLDGAGNVNIKSVTAWDEAGNITSQEQYSANGNLLTRFTYTWVAVEVPVKE